MPHADRRLRRFPATLTLRPCARLHPYLLLWCVGAACDPRDLLVDAAPSSTTERVAFTIVAADPPFGGAAQQADRAWVHVARLSGEVVIDTIVLFPASAQELTLQVPVTLREDRESFSISTELREGDFVVSRGVASVDAERGAVAETTVIVAPEVATVAAGTDHSCALRVNDGQAFCWGSNQVGQLGTGTAEPFSAVPLPVAGGRTYTAVYAGNFYSCALDLGGQAYCWGLNSLGQLGDGTTTNRSVPAAVGGTHRFRSLTLSISHTCGLTLAGDAYCWGNDSFGQLSGASGPSSFVPVPGPEPGPLRSVRAGGGHTCVLTLAGVVRCWGNHTVGAGGEAPETVPGRYIAVASGNSFTCALALSGAAFCWGANASGSLGDGTQMGSAEPVPVAGGLRFRALSSLGLNACGITGSGEVYCWGSLWDRAGGTSYAFYGTRPVLVGGGQSFVAVSAGYDHACAITSDAPHCWGAETWGKLGTGETGIVAQPTRVDGPGFSTVSVGVQHSCGVTPGGQVQCWGHRAWSAVGAPVEGWATSPAPVAGGDGFRTVAAGRLYTCGLTTGDAAYCWGTDGSGQFGTGVTNATSPTPIPTTGGHRFRTLATKQSHTCGIELATDRVMCWGRNLNGELGDGSTNQRSTPGYIAGSDAYDNIAVGGQHTCGVRADGVVLCWGGGGNYQLGSGSTTGTATPTPIASGLSFASVAAGANVSCAIALNGDAYCWGNDSRGMLGNGTGGQSQPVPAPVVGGHSFTSLTIGGVTVCGLTSNGAALCWGSNQYGQLGTGTIDLLPHATPQPVAGGLRFTAISADLYHVCGVANDGTTYCWGARRHGILGDGNLGMVSSPQRVTGW